MSNGLFSHRCQRAVGCSEAPAPAGTPRVLMAERNQIALRPVDLEATVGPEHAVRSVWAFVERLDLSALYGADRLGRGWVGSAGH